MKLILQAKDYPEYAEFMGGKAKALAALSQAGFRIPEWFVVTPEAFKQSLTSKQQKQWASCEDEECTQTVLQDLLVSRTVKDALYDALASFDKDTLFAVRSSASDEDGIAHSFAGQLDSFLFVRKEDIAARVLDVWRSGFAERVLFYRQKAGLAFLPTAPSVLIQKMINADVSGVAFSADPVTGQRDTRVVSAVYGLGTALVSGEADADTYQITASGIVNKKDIAHKVTAHRQNATHLEGVSSEVVALALQDKAALSNEQATEVATLATKASSHFGRPQDIEWAMEAQELYLLQSRPITSLFSLADPNGILGIWDNSNIVESYGGVTTPLTFSFALYAYEGVYRELLRILGVSKKKRLEQENTFKHMLGLIDGRIYYNLLSWYKLLATLPGFKLNQAFMEQMMGVKEGLPAEILADLQAQSSSKLRDAWDLASAALGLIRANQKLPRDIRKFYKRLDIALAFPSVSLEDMRADELVTHYHDLEAKLLKNWDAPLVNDFFAMIFYGVLKRLCENWANDTDGSLQNQLVAAEGGMISAEPA